MNFDFYTKMPTCDLKQIIPELVFHLHKNLDKTMNDIHECIDYISKLSPNIEIYVLGVYAMLENKALRTIVQPLYAIYNSKIQKICSEYQNVHYVDIFGTKKYIAYHDNHPTFEGQKYIAKQIIKTMNRK